MNTGYVLLSSFIVQIKQTFARAMYKFCALVSPLVNTVLLGEMFKLSSSSSSSFTSYVILGAGLMSLWECICFSSVSDINRERYSNTLSRIFVSPSNFWVILFGKVFGNTVLSLSSFALTLLFSVLLYNQKVIIPHILPFILSFGMVIISFVVFSIVVAFALTLSRKTVILMNCLDIPLTIICGFAFPIELLPSIIQKFAAILPMTWSVKLLRHCVGESIKFEYFIQCMSMAIGTTIVLILLSCYLYRVILRQVRIKATLDLA